MFSAIVFWAFVGWAAIQGAYALLFLRFFALPERENPIADADMRPVSVVICAKNEAENLLKNLPAVLAQRYSNKSGRSLFEVVVVNDCSTDDTHEILHGLSAQFPNLKEVVITPETQRTVHGKKFALSTGVNAAAHDRILLTDADCQPASGRWIANMVEPLARGKQIVAGYSGHDEAPGWLNRFIRWETMHTFLQLATYAMAGYPYLAIGRNMACTRAVCLNAFNAPGWNLIPTGDDDLLVSSNANRHNVAVVCTPAAFTHTLPMPSVREWKQQKQRHTSDGKYYRPVIKLMLGVYGVSQAAVWVYYLYLLFTPYALSATLVLAARCLVYWCLWAAVAKKLHEKRLSAYLPFFDIGWMLYNFTFLPYILSKNRKHWE